MITVNVDKAKVIAHKLRRIAREDEFQPYDNVVMKQIPGQVEAAEAERAKIRAKYAVIQENIDAAATPTEIKQALDATAQSIN